MLKNIVKRVHLYSSVAGCYCKCLLTQRLVNIEVFHFVWMKNKIATVKVLYSSEFKSIFNFVQIKIFTY